MPYTITLADGTKLENVMVNGDNFIVDYEITVDTFKGNLSSVTISGSESPDVFTGVHPHMELLALQHGEPYMQPGEYWFVLGDVPEEELRTRAIESGVNDAYEATAELGVDVANNEEMLDVIMEAIAELGVAVEEISNG